MKRFFLIIILLLVCSLGRAHAQLCQATANGSITINGAATVCGIPTATLSSIAVSPATTTAEFTTTTNYTALGTFSDGSQSDVTSQCSWASSNTVIADIDAAATPQPVSCQSAVQGTANILCTIGNVVGTASLTCQEPVILTTSLPPGVTSTAYSASITGDGGTPPYSWSVVGGALPSWATLNNTSPTATITGTPPANGAGTSTFTIQLQDNVGAVVTQVFTITITSAQAQTPILPQAWANEQESNQTAYTNTVNFPSSGSGGAWSCHGTAKGPYTFGLAGLQTAIADLEACRASFGDSAEILFQPGFLLSFSQSVNNTPGTHGVYLTQNATDTSTSPIVFDSTKPVPLGTNLDPNGVPMQARVGTYAIASTDGIVCTSTFCTLTTAVSMAAVPSVGDLATIWQPDNRTFAGQYTICNHTTAGCSDPTANAFMYPWTGSAGTTENGTLFSLQKSNAITSMSAAGCNASSAQCTVTMNFASSPGLSVNDRFEVTGATPSFYNGTWYVASVGTNSATFFSYTEYIGNGSASVPGTVLHKNHILSDQVACCMYTLELSGGGGPLLMGDPQFHNYAIYDAELRTAQANTNETFDFLLLGSYLNPEPAQNPPQMSVAGCNGSPAQANCSEPVHVGFDRDYIHGYSFPVVTNTTAMIRGAIRAECGWCYLTNSYAEDINDQNSDDNIISTTTGTGPVKVVNNFLEGSTEAIMSGYYNGCLKVAAPFQQVADYEIRRNWITGNQFQTMNTSVTIPGGTTKYLLYILKNKVEVKAGQRVLYDGNVIQYSAGAAGQQNGFLLSINDQGTTVSGTQCSLTSASQDILYSNNILRHALSGGYETNRAAPGTSSGQTSEGGRQEYVNNLGYDLGDVTRFGRQGWGGTSWSGFGLSAVQQLGTRGFQFAGCTGTSATNNSVTTATLTCPNNPVGTPSALQQGMGINVGDWLEVINCSDANYNVQAPLQVPATAVGFSNFTVSYTVPSTAGATVTGCQVDNWYGNPRWLTYLHNTMVYDGTITNSFYNNVKMAAGEEFLFTSQALLFSMKRDNWIKDNILSFKSTSTNLLQCAGTGSSNSHGETFCQDTNSFVWTNNVMTGGGTAANYTEYNAPAGIPGANNAASPPVTDIFLANGTPGDACSNINSPTSSCIGFTGNYSTTNPPDFAPSTADYHVFGLVSNSNWAAGQAGQAPDGTSVGVNLNTLDSALTLSQYVCGSSCGAGPPSPASLSISTNSLPGGTVGTPYTASLSAFGGAPPYQWTIPGGAIPSSAVDVLDYAIMPLPARNTLHLTGGTDKSFVLNAGLFWWLKGATGNPWDIVAYDGNHLYQWGTEDGDAADQTACLNAGFASCFVDPFASKLYVTPVPIWPRYFVLGGADVVTKNPTPNNIKRTTNCGSDNQALINIGNIIGILHDAGNTSWGGSIGTVRTLIGYYYWGLADATTVPPVSGTRERYWLAKGFGQVQWDTSHWDSGSSSYIVDQTSTNTTIVNGGAPTPNFACGLPNTPLTSGLPTGVVSTSSAEMNVSDATGSISGTPTATGTSSFVAQVEDSSGAMAQKSLSISVTSLTGNFYVAPPPTGNDSNLGTISAPFATIGHAASVASSGQTVIIENGTYPEQVTFGNSGTPGHQITFIAQNKWGAIVAPSGAGQIFTINGSYVTIENLLLQGNASGTNNDGMKFQSPGTGGQAIGNKVTRIGTGNCSGGAPIISAQGSTLISGNYIYNYGDVGCNQYEGVYLNDGNNQTVVNNVIFEGVGTSSSSTIGIQVNGQQAVTANFPSNENVSNNTLFNLTGWCSLWASWSGTASGNNFNNNVCYNTGTNGTSGSLRTANNGGGFSGDLFSNDLINSSGSTSLASGTSLTNEVTSAPGFVSYTGDQTGDYHPASGSALIGAGTATGCPATDFDGDSRSGTCWIGAYQNTQ